MTEETIKGIKHGFMAYRNGIVADTLRKAGMPYGIIFGLQLPQISAIAREVGYNQEVAEALWLDRNVRESRLLAAYLFEPEKIDYDAAMSLAIDVQTKEEADILCFRLLRKLPEAGTLRERLKESSEELARYCGEALQRNLDA